jgi:hypothetical protein
MKNTMQSIRYLILAASLPILASCSHVDITKTGSGIYPPTAQAYVEIRATVPDRKFEEIGMVTVDAYGKASDAYNLIREKAAAVGADAVILQNQTPVPPRLLINGVAIKYKR